jgi:1-acyl-sn-glycerol-3-phosphate acyltransferase
MFIFFFLLSYPLLIILLSKPKFYLAANRLRRAWAFTIFFMSGLPYSIEYRGKLRKDQAYIYCPNHSSYLDIPLVMLASQGNIRFMAKMELGKIPIFNIFFRTVDISVNRESRSDSYKALKEAEQSLDEGYNLVIFPEGTIGDNVPNLIKFKNGPFKLAIEKQVPIIPVTIIDNWKHLYVGKRIYGKPGFLRAVIHEPIDTKGMTVEDVGMLSDKVKDIIQTELIKYQTLIAVS